MASDEAVTFDGVVEALVEAYGFLMRLPDRERSFLQAGSRVSSIYDRGTLTEADVWTAFGWLAGVFDEEATPRLPGLRAPEVDRMWSTLAWVEWVEPDHRRLVGVVLAMLHRGEARPPWRAIKGKMGWGGHEDALRRRWERAVHRIAVKLARGENGGNLRP